MKIEVEGKKAGFVEVSSPIISAEDFNKVYASGKTDSYELEGDKFVVAKDKETGLKVVYCLEKGAQEARMVPHYEAKKDGITIYYTGKDEQPAVTKAYTSNDATKIGTAAVEFAEALEAEAEAKKVADLVAKWVEDTKEANFNYGVAKQDVEDAQKRLAEEQGKTAGLQAAAEAACTALSKKLNFVDSEGKNAEEKINNLLKNLDEGLRARADTVAAEELKAFETACAAVNENAILIEQYTEEAKSAKGRLITSGIFLNKAHTDSEAFKELKEHDGIKAAIEEFEKKTAEEQHATWSQIDNSAQQALKDATNASKKAAKKYKVDAELDIILNKVASQPKYDALYRSVKGTLPIIADSPVEIKQGEKKLTFFLAPAANVENWGEKYNPYTGKLQMYVFEGAKADLIKGLYENRKEMLNNAHAIDTVLSNGDKENERAAIVYYQNSELKDGQFVDKTKAHIYINADTLNLLKEIDKAYTEDYPDRVDNRNLVVVNKKKYNDTMKTLKGTNENKKSVILKGAIVVGTILVVGFLTLVGVKHISNRISTTNSMITAAEREKDLGNLPNESVQAYNYGKEQGKDAQYTIAYNKEGKPTYYNIQTLDTVDAYKQQNTGELELTDAEYEEVDAKFGYTEETEKGFAYGVGSNIAQQLANDGVVTLAYVSDNGTKINYYIDNEILATYDQDELRAGYADQVHEIVEDKEIGGNAVQTEGIDQTNTKLTDAAEKVIEDQIKKDIEIGRVAKENDTVVYAFTEDGVKAYRINIEGGDNALTTAQLAELVANGTYDAELTRATEKFGSSNAFWADKYAEDFKFTGPNKGHITYAVVATKNGQVDAIVTTKKSNVVTWIGQGKANTDTLSKVAIKNTEGNTTISIKGSENVSIEGKTNDGQGKE